MAFISIGKIDKNLIPMLAGCIFCFLNRLLNKYDDSLLFTNQIMMNIYISSSKLLTIAPYIIFLINSKKVHSNEIQLKNYTKSFLYKQLNKNVNKIIKGKWAFIILAAIIYLFNQFFFVFTIKIKSNTTILNILITSIFYYLIFKIKLYRHHYLSVILIILVGLIIDIILGNLQYDTSTNLGLFFFRLLRECLYSLSSVVDKYIMEKKFGSVYEILLSNGVITTTIFIIAAIIDSKYFGYYDYEGYFTNFDWIEFLVAAGTIISQFGLNLCILLTNKSNSPCHIFIIFIFGQLAYYINFTGISIIVILCLIIILFLSFIFNEIIEINCFSLSKNTKNNISRRASNEDNNLIVSYDYNDNDSYDITLESKEGYILKNKDIKNTELDEVSEEYE